jgi:hypothetical protein
MTNDERERLECLPHGARGELDNFRLYRDSDSFGNVATNTYHEVFAQYRAEAQRFLDKYPGDQQAQGCIEEADAFLAEIARPQ